MALLLLGCKLLSLFLLSLIFLQVSPSLSDPLYRSCGSTKYTANSTYESNLLALLPSLVYYGSDQGFYKNIVGRVLDQIYALSLCRGDTNTSSCWSCLDLARQNALQFCAYNKATIIYYDNCLLRYSNQNFLNSTDNSDVILMLNIEDVTDPDNFIKLPSELVNRTFHYAAFKSSQRFGTGEANFTDAEPKLYGLEQCSRDFSGDQCYNCLTGMLPVLQNIAGKRGGRVIGSRCYFRYELYPFYEGESILQLPSSSSSPPPQSNGTNTTGNGNPTPAVLPTVGSGDGNKNNIRMILAIVIPLVIAFLLISCICFWRRRRLAKKFPHDTNPEEITSVESILFDLSTLRNATANFSEENKLGEGGFGSVYKGTLHNGREIAVKRLSAGSGQGIGELKNELVLVAKLQHRNLVRLLGVCLEKQEKMLVYEYVPNRSLDTILFDSIKREQLYWGRRYKIITGIARGLLYLHEDSQLKIIHRDLKASNILLDEDMNAKISDFGLARLVGGDQTGGSTSRVAGTFGYMAPEYVMRGKFSAKSDIFSFGVLVLEILTGQKNSNFSETEQVQDLLSCAWEHWTRGTISEILDPSLGDQLPRSEALRCIHMGLLCVQEDPASRPSMSMVVLMLNSYSVSLQAPSKPAFFYGLSGGMDSDTFRKGYNFSNGEFNRSSDKSIPMTPNEVSISEMEPR
ncbi:hypothetical protein J5N97_011550 [Dioscorea zingiberensis]|uniref:Cysteine-rich receptor-like protein kinase 10 n=1 Tax=Dioscorea zingiberensis TaxID=325984 RepID=A0A9D5HNG5_9LILI|nr:hypothetical protein J5N97_011550 [Dioscorea zingiberensis]